jgi:hypothetical protein
MQNKQFPNNQEVSNWFIHVLQHSCHVEYYLGKLDIGHSDPERPHDIVGPGNKYLFEVAKGFAVAHKTPHMGFFYHHVNPCRELHRQQRHHKWNNVSLDNINTFEDDELMVGAVDSICSLLENRPYQGGVHSFAEISSVIDQDTNPIKKKWLYLMLDRIKSVATPNLNSIVSLSEISNFGLPPKIYEKVVDRTHEAVDVLAKDYGYDLRN